MQKILQIIKLEEANVCHQLQADFKTERHNLKRYLKSLKELKSRVKDDHHYFANLVSESNKIVQNQSGIKKKNSELDYYMINGVKPLKAFHLETKKLENFYLGIQQQSKDLVDRILKYLDQSKQSFTRASKQHEKIVKDYADKCYPETTTILYILGFVSNEKVKKIEDSLKEQGLLRETQMYTKVLNTYLDQMQALKGQATKLFNAYYIEAAQLWIKCCDDMQKEFQSYEIKEEELQEYYKETGGANTDRSERSNKDNHLGQEQI